MRVGLALVVLALLTAPVFLAPVAVSSSPLDVSATAGTVCDVTGHCLQFVTVPPQFLDRLRILPDGAVSIQQVEVNWGMVILDFRVVNGSVLSYRIYGSTDMETVVFRCSFQFYNASNAFQADGGCVREKYEMIPPPPPKSTWDQVSQGAAIARDVAITAYIVYKIIKG